MKLSDQRKLNFLLLCCCGAALFLSLGVSQFTQAKQTLQQTPAPTGHVNDFAGVVDEQTRRQLENILSNLKLKTGIEFDIATVQSTAGVDIFDFSRQLAKEWNVGARTSAKKSLLLVVSVNDKASFTQFSKSVQGDLPEGILGEMGQRMRAPVAAGQFSEGLNAAVQHFANSLAQKLSLGADAFAQPPVAVAVSTPEPAPVETPAETSATKPTDEAGPAITKTTTVESAPVVVKAPAPRKEVPAARTRKPASVGDDEADAEEVELTLTKPIETRIALLKAFIDSHPYSKSMVRATELLVSSRATLGDGRLKNGDHPGGVEQLMQALADAPTTASDNLFSGVISQIPLNLYLRGEPAAALKAAQMIEAKFGADPKRLAALSGFYVSTEQGAEATRLAAQAVKLAPDLAEAHQALALALHISLRLDEAAAEYKRALELDPNSKAARRSLADLDRASGKSEEALALYRQQLETEPKDKAARAGLILSLLDLGKTDEAKGELEKALAADPRNVTLLAGAAYWFAAHNDNEFALGLARKAVDIEPRYTWSQIALARALVAQRKPLDAERAIRYARQYGKFPTLDYELASTLAAAALYDEAAEVLMASFSLKDGQIETKLGGQVAAHGANFTELLAPERRASIFQLTAADSERNAELLKALLAFAVATNLDGNDGTVDEARAIASAKEFGGGDDAARVHRQLYAANRLLKKGIGFQTAYELAEAARTSADAGMTVPDLTVAVQADEFRAIRARAIAAGGTPDIPEAPRNVLSNLLRGRIEDITGWALFNQDKVDEAVEHLKRAVAVLPAGTPAAQSSLWHLGAALERQDNKAEALSNYIKSYNSGEPDPVRRAVIEQLYRKVNGSLDGLNERIGPAAVLTSSVTPPAEKAADTSTTDGAPASSTPASTPASTPESSPAPSPSPSESPEPAGPTATPEATPAATPKVTPGPSPTQTSEAQPSATPEPPPSESAGPSGPTATRAATPAATPAPSSPSLSTSPVEKMDAPVRPVLPVRTTITISGRVKDANDNPLANVVVVLISPQGTVLAATTDEQGNYSFKVAPSAATSNYRLIPSREGFAFEPIDRVPPIGTEDVTALDFVGTTSRKP